MSKDPNIRHGKDSRNGDFYKDPCDYLLNTAIEKNFDDMLSKLLASPDFIKLIDDSQLFKEVLNISHIERLLNIPKSIKMAAKPDFKNLADYLYSKFVLQDGIYPRYCKQDFKILFIGRDAYGLTGYDYTWSTWDKFKKKKKAFNRTVLSIAYYFSAGKRIEDDKCKKEPEIANKVVNECFDVFDLDNPPFSFACINASKIDRHKNGDRVFDREAAELFFNVVGQDLITDQVDIINPDLIIGANLRGCKLTDPRIIENIFNCYEFEGSEKNNFKVYCYTSKNNPTRIIPFVDTNKHFSAYKENSEIESLIVELDGYLTAKTKISWPLS